MLSVVSLALLALAASAAPPAIRDPLSVAPLQHAPLAMAASTASFIPQQYQVSPFQGSHLNAYQHQIQPQLMRFGAPIAPTTPVDPVDTITPVAKPILKAYDGQYAPQPQWAILRSNMDDNFDGHFQYDFETENGISMASSGALRQVAPDAFGQVMQGQYSYTAPDGQVITTTYTADENGFVASGAHLPQAPAVPELPPLIAKSLAYIASIPPRPEYQQ